MTPIDPRRRTALRTLLSLGALLALPAAAASDESTHCDVPASHETFVASVDRIVDGRFVVLLLEDDGDVVDQLVVSREELPEVEEGDVLCVVLEDCELLDAEPLAEETERRRERAGGRLTKLLDG